MARTISAAVRAPARSELPRAAEIAMIAFHGNQIKSWLNSYNWIADNRGLEYLVVVEADGELVASLLCTPGAVRFTDDIVPLSAVGGVATLPEHRNHGYAGMMMQEAVKILYRNGYHTSALWPFSCSYYRKFGWEVGSEHRSYIVPSELAAELASPDGTRPALETDLPAISRLVDRFARRYNCVTIRDDLWWSCMRATYRFEFEYNEESRASIWVHETGKSIDGYAIFEVAGEGEEKSVRVKEIVADTPAARNSILSRLASVGAQHIVFPAPIDDGFLQELANPRAVRSELHPGFQFRAINPPAALELRSVDPKLAGCLGFTVSDPVLDGFDFDIEVADGRITKAKCRAEERLSMNIQTFSQAYCGYVSSIRAAELGRVEATSQRAVEFADRLFPKVVPFRSMMELG